MKDATFENSNSSKIMRETVSMTNKGPQMYEYFEAFSQKSSKNVEIVY